MSPQFSPHLAQDVDSQSECLTAGSQRSDKARVYVIRRSLRGLADILIPDAPEMETSQRLLDAGLQQRGLVISGIAYAELAAHFPT